MLRERNYFWLKNCETQHKLNFLLFMREKKTETRLVYKIPVTMWILILSLDCVNILLSTVRTVFI